MLEQVIRELNITWRKSLGISIDLLRWETHAVPGIGSEPQSLINEQIGDDYDIFIGIIWSRFGTETKQYGSGTEEEFRRAHQRWLSDNKSVQIMFYFNEAGISPNKMDFDQLKRIQNFRCSLGDEGVLYWHYKDEGHFSQLLRIHLSRVVQNWAANAHSQSSSPTVDSPKIVAAEGRDCSLATVGDTVGVGEDDEVGFLDLFESLEDSILEMNDVAVRMSHSTNKIGSDMVRRTAELENLKRDGQLDDFRAVKRVINNASQDLDHFSSGLEVDIYKFSECNRQIAESTTKLASIFAEFPAGQERLGDLIKILDQLFDPIEELPATIQGFRDTIHAIPRSTSKYNKSKKNAVSTLDKLLCAIDEAVSIGKESRATVVQIDNQLKGVVDV